jgi:dTDP-4-dehydrorhamnose 3,5-epimerase
MKFTETSLSGAYLIDIEPHCDERGFFARAWCEREFQDHGLNACVVQCNVSFNAKEGTLRGMHYQEAPFAEVKLVRCTRGAIYDVIVDMRPDSPTYRQYLGVALNPDNRTMLYVPEGFAHGFLTLADETEVFYQMSEFYSAPHSRGFRWDDPKVGIRWPEDVAVISERDRTYPDLD